MKVRRFNELRGVHLEEQHVHPPPVMFDSKSELFFFIITSLLSFADILNYFLNLQLMQQPILNYAWETIKNLL